MKIYFKTRKIERICNRAKDADKALGNQCAAKLKQRLFELKAADKLADISHLPPPRLHELTGNRKGQFSVDLKHPYRLLFIPADEPLPLRNDGGYDLDNVREIEIIEIADTH